MTGFQPNPRIGWLDGLRGLAALQVVLFHYVSAFLPAIGFTDPQLAHYAWERAFIGTPFGLLFDGSSAVYLFFIISGVALTYSFSISPFDIRSAVTRRLIRLGIPMAAALVFAAILFLLAPDVTGFVARQTGSAWFGYVGPRDLSPSSIAHQITFEGLLAGYKTTSLLPGWAAGWFGLIPADHSLNAPLWTLHVEFYGSILVLLLVSLRAVCQRPVYLLACAVLGFGELAMLNPLCLFVAGHLVAHGLGQTGVRRWENLIGAGLLLTGILFCTASAGLAPWLCNLLAPFRSGLPDDAVVLQKMAGSCLIFGGLTCLPVLQRQLMRPAMRWLGKISFSLYLTHFPLLFTAVATGYVVLDGFLPFGAKVAVVSVVGIVVSIAVAAEFERRIDAPATALSRIAGGSRRRPIGSAPEVRAA